MKLSIINGDAGDDTVVIDGIACHFDLAGLIDDTIWAVQWSDEGDKPEGEVELRDGTHKKIKSIKPFRRIINRWQEEKAKTDQQEEKDQAFLKSRQFALDLIDNTAGKVRLRFVPIGYGMTDEYARVKSEAQRFIEAGFAGDVPAVVQTHAEVKGVAPREAAETILQAAIKWNNALDKIRDIRIKAKAQVEKAEEGADYIAIARPFLDTLKTLES
ncbi:hypothetical protein [uncultured Microbulbifer sp.]|uniref:hypothetical protein n=1 Tax=uncultured Microbulbifer sp. TaxID=348147 RepID=UPI00262FB3CF|nr:hypothetical protein [uncultured Microbulbifer sp.]